MNVHLMSDFRSSVSVSRFDVGAADFDFGPSIGRRVEATKEIVSAALKSIPDESSVTTWLICPAGEDVKLAIEEPTLQIVSW